jgi:hypothetical protein
MNFKMIAAAVALVATGAANAAANAYNSGNSDVLFYAYDLTAQTSVIADLGATVNDFMPSHYTVPDGQGGITAGAVPQGALDMAGATASWNLKGGSFASAFNSFLASAGSDTIYWGVLAGDDATSSASPDNGGKYLVTGAPTSAQLAAPGNIGNLAPIGQTLFTKVNAGGAYFAASSNDNGYVAGKLNLNTQGNYQVNLGWQAVTGTTATGTSSTNLTLVTESPAAFRVGQVGSAFGALSLNASTGALTWNAATAVTPSVPEPATYGMALVGLIAAGLVRRRAAK